MFEDIFEEMKKMQKEFDKIFSQISKQMETSGIREPATDIAEKDNKIIVKVDMPGVKKEDIELVVNKDSISIKAERKEFAEESKEGFFRRERSYKGYSVYRTLPVEVKPETAEAKYEDGVLTVEIEKAEEKEKKGKKVEVK